MNRWTRLALVLELVFCVGPFALLLFMGLVLTPIQVQALVQEPLLWRGPLLVISLVLGGCAGLWGLAFVLFRLFRARPIDRPVPVLIAIFAGLAALAFFLVGGDSSWRFLALLPLLASAHVLYLSRAVLLQPLISSRQLSGVNCLWLLLPVLLAVGALMITTRGVLSHEELISRREFWRSSRPAAYSYHLQISGQQMPELLYPRKIEVRGDSVRSATYTFVRGPLETTTYPPAEQAAWTMDRVFEELSKAQSRGARVRVRFDARWGFVERAFLESAQPNSDWDLEAHDFEPTP